MPWRILLLCAVLLAGCVPASQERRPVPSGLPEPPIAVAAPAVSPLAVTAVVPEPNASAVLFDSAVFVQFNHPVVPLSTLNQPVLNSPLQIDPPVGGTGRWITTGLYTFTPADGWAASSTYHLSVPRTEYAWSFTTLPAAVASTNPAPGASLIDPAAPVRVTFNQPVDRASVHLRFSPSAAGRSAWPDSQTLLFHPDVALAAATDYDIQVAIDGAANPYTWRFSTAPRPSLLRTVPNEGTEAPQLNQLELFFTVPMDRDDVRSNLQIEPQLCYAPFPV